MIRSRHFRQAAAAALVLSVASCIDGREEYWLQADGRGRAEITYRVPAAAAALHGGESGIRKALGQFIRETPEITAGSCEVATEGGRLRVTLRASFDSALAIKDLVSGKSMKHLPPAATGLVGKITTNLEGWTIHFSRRISASKAIPGSPFLPASQLEGHRLTYIVHLPAVPGESNAMRTEDGGRTLVWDVPLAQAVQGPVMTRFQMRVPVSWRLVSLIAAPVLLLLGAFWFLIRKWLAARGIRRGNPPDPVL